MAREWRELGQDLRDLVWLGRDVAEDLVRDRAAQRPGKRLWKEHPRFYPFGYVLGNDGEVSVIEGHAGRGLPDPEEISKRVERDIKAAVREGARAALMALDAVGTSPDGKRRDFILLWVQDVSGERLQISIPYKRRWGQLRFGELEWGLLDVHESDAAG